MDANAPPPSLTLRSPWAWLVFALALAVYAQTLAHGFVYDDEAAIVHNTVVSGRFSLWDLLRTDFWGYPLVHARLVGTYRPVVTLLFALQWHAGGGAAWLFHATSALLHAAASVALLLVAARRPATRDGRAPAVLAAALFAVHPLHTESVASVVGQADLVAFLLALAVWRLHARPGAAATAGAGAAFLLAMLTKESSVALVPLLVLHDLGRTPVARRALAARYALYAAGVAVAVAARVQVLGSVRGFGVTRTNNPLVVATLLERELTAARMFFRGLELLVAPVNLLPDYGAAVVTPSARLDAPAALGVAALVALVALGVRAFRRAHHRAEAVAWLVLPGLLSVNAFALSSTPFAERLWYLPSAGACLLWGELVGWASARTRRGIALALGLVPVLALAPLTVLRNRDWATSERLFEAAVETDPRSALMHYNLAQVRIRQGRLGDAYAHCTAASRLAPWWGSPHGCRASLLADAGQSAEAFEAFKAMGRGEALAHDWWVAYARFMARRGRPDVARALLARLRTADRWSDEEYRRREREVFAPP